MRIAGLFRLDDGSTIMCQVPLTEAEQKVYRESPTTFFGIHEPKKKIEDPGELYDLFLATYKQTSHDRLLELLAGHADCPSSTLSSGAGNRETCSARWHMPTE
jgi:hypothetical protein